MIKTSELREKEIINIRDGTRLGIISDIDIDLEKGVIQSIIIPGQGRILGIFGRNADIEIKWKNIVKIGKDVILVDLNQEWSNPDEDNS